jgi:hypothetical protein
MTNYVVRHGKRIKVTTIDEPPRRHKEPHFGCPLEWVKRIRKVVRSLDQMLVAIWLYRRRIISGKDLFLVPNHRLELELGISRKVKYATLQRLEEVGAITIVRESNRASRVRILW